MLYIFIYVLILCELLKSTHIFRDEILSVKKKINLLTVIQSVIGRAGVQIQPHQAAKLHSVTQP